MSQEPSRDESGLGFGARLSAEEYDRRIIELYRGLPPMPGRAQEEEIRKRELNLKIDYRLGMAFPPERRAALWEIQQRLEKKRLRLAFKYLLRRCFPKTLARGAQDLAGYMVDEYARVLTAEELRAFFDLEKGESPALPVDMEQFRK